ncbi:MAG: protein-L-isoaspartate(D-aspartate) O-methyltransferase [Pseudomonadota bacterium]
MDAGADPTSEARERMVRDQIERRGLREPRLTRALRRVPRHRFMPEVRSQQAYGDHPLPIGSSQTISQPYIVALMTSELQLRGTERVLELGTGSGYQTAVLAELAAEVFTVERLPELAERARSLLEVLGYANIQFRTGDGTVGWSEAAPFDGILVTAGSPRLPRPLIDQLAEGGRLVVPVGDRWVQDLAVVEKRAGGALDETSAGGCRFVPLIGEHGWDG